MRPSLTHQPKAALPAVGAQDSLIAASKVWPSVGAGLRRMLTAMFIAAIIVVGGGLSAPQPAEAAVAGCGGGRCTVYLSKSETRSVSHGRVPAPPAWVPWQIKSAYYATAYGHRWFAGQYANRGMCSGFRLSIYPWETQGYFGYHCNWR